MDNRNTITTKLEHKFSVADTVYLYYVTDDGKTHKGKAFITGTDNFIGYLVYYLSGHPTNRFYYEFTLVTIRMVLTEKKIEWRIA